MGLGKHGGIIYFNIPNAVATGVFHIRRPRTAITGHASGQTLIPNSLGRRKLHIGRQETRRTREPVRKTYNRKHKTIRKMNRSKKNGRTIGAMALIASMIPVVLTAQARETGVDKTTWLYAVKGTDSLYMDRYVAEASRETNAPCLIFAFGGGFVGGERDNPAYVPYFEYFARKGYAVISIDYRLGLRETAGSRPDPADTPEALAERFFAAVDMAVEDLYDATSFIVGQARAWGLDPSAVVASGSSAGAITVLQGEYERCTGSALSRRLPEGFRYAGIIAFAGAVLEKSSSGPVWREKPAPIQLFHGDADCNVPYDSIGTGGAALYGSFYLSRQFRRMNTPFYFYSVSSAAHEMAVRPMDRNRAEIGIFLDRLVLGREALMIETQVERIGTPATRKKITLSDFIRANSGT